jgi:hypothetical protein
VRLLVWWLDWPMEIEGVTSAGCSLSSAPSSLLGQGPEAFGGVTLPCSLTHTSRAEAVPGWPARPV